MSSVVKDVCPFICAFIATGKEDKLPESGLHLALSKQEAKQLFGRRTDEELRKLLSDLAESLRPSGRCFDSGNLWNPLHRCLGDGTLQADAGEYPLNQCILGGRPLAPPAEARIVLVRPDLLPHLVQRLDEVSPAWLQTQYDQIDPAEYELEKSAEQFQQLWNCFDSLREFFRRAATDKQAVVFTNADLAAT